MLKPSKKRKPSHITIKNITAHPDKWDRAVGAGLGEQPWAKLWQPKRKRKPSYKQVAREFKEGSSPGWLALKYDLFLVTVEAMIRRALREQGK